MIDQRFSLADQYNRQGIKYADQGKFNQAITAFTKAIKVFPTANSYYFLGITYKRMGKTEKAERKYQQAIKLSPHFSMAHNNLGALCLEKKDFPQAIQQFQAAIEADPNNSRAYNNLGNAYKSARQLEKAVENYQKALELEPNIPETFNNLGLVFFEQGSMEKAIKYLEKAVKIAPGYAQAYFHLSLVLAKQKNWERAVEYLEKYLQSVTDDSQAYALLGNFCLKLGDLKKSEIYFKKSLSIKPDSPYTINDLGNLYKQAGDLDKALEYYQKALEYDPFLAGTYNNLGVVFLNQEKLEEALKVFKKALELDSQLASAHYHLGLIYERQRQLDEAAKSFQAALKVDPKITPALSLLVYVSMQACDWAKFLQQAVQLDKLFLEGIKSGQELGEEPFLSVIRKENPKINFLVAKNKSEQIKKTIARTAKTYSFADRKSPPTGEAGKKILRIGYLSNDFYAHATAHLTLRLFSAHDRKKFQVYTYSYGPNDRSQYRKRIEKDCDQFWDIFNLGFQETAKQIYQDKIDILMDLKGHTRDSRLEICALRPAPIQVHYLGFPGTTGADFFDYFITDRIVTPPTTASFFSEKLVYLPDCYQINDNQRPIWPGKFKKIALNLPADTNSIIFSSFNRPYKIDPLTFKTWMNILAKVPKSVLWLLEDNPFSEKNLLKEAKAAKIEPKRIIFGQKMPHEKHLKRISLSDLSLDTFICNGHTTTSDCLWAGVPVITLQGKHFASRVASSILTAVGLPELITQSPKEYEDLAVELARNSKKLDVIRPKLNANRLNKPLFDTQKFVTNLEKAYTQMWSLYQAGKKPEQININ